MSLGLQRFILFSSMYVLLAWGLYLPYRTGKLSLVAAYCMPIGAYAAAYSVKTWGIPFPVAVIIALVLAGVAAFIPAVGLRKAPGFTAAIATIALLFIIRTLVQNLAFLGGEAGFFGIPKVGYILPFALGSLVVVGALIRRFDRSFLGRAADTVRLDEDVAESTGSNMARLNMGLQVAGGVLGGLAGVVYAFTVGSVFPAAFGFSLLIYMATGVFVGGSQTLWGSLVLMPVLWGIPLILPEALAQWRDVIWGALLIAMLLARPEGLVTRRLLTTISERLARPKVGLRADSERGSEG